MTYCSGPTKESHGKMDLFYLMRRSQRHGINIHTTSTQHTKNAASDEGDGADGHEGHDGDDGDDGCW